MKVGPRPRFSCPRPEPCTSSGSRRLGREVPCPPPVDWFPVPPNAPLSKQTNVRFSVASAVPSRQEDDVPKAPSSREQSPIFKHRVVRVVDERYRFPVPSINLTETGYSRRIKEVFLRAPAEI